MPALTASLSSRLYIVGIGNDESASNAIFTRADSPILKMKGFNPNCPEVYGNPGSVRGKDLHRPQGHVRSLHVEPLAARPWPERA